MGADLCRGTVQQYVIRNCVCLPAVLNAQGGECRRTDHNKQVTELRKELMAQLNPMGQTSVS